MCNGNLVKATAHWDGDELVIDSRVFALRHADIEGSLVGFRGRQDADTDAAYQRGQKRRAEDYFRQAVRDRKCWYTSATGSPITLK